MDTAPRAGHTAQTNIENSYFDPKLRIYAFQMKKIQKFVLFEFGPGCFQAPMSPSGNLLIRRGNFFLIGTGVLDHPTYKTGNSTLHP